MGSLSNDTAALRAVAWGIVHNARRLHLAQLVGRPLWSLVMELTGQGSTTAKELCREFEADPDEIITGASPGFVYLTTEQLDAFLVELVDELDSRETETDDEVLARVKAAHGIGRSE